MQIYKITNLINNKIYIGQQKENNKKDYMGSGNLIKLAILNMAKKILKKKF